MGSEISCGGGGGGGGVSTLATSTACLGRTERFTVTTEKAARERRKRISTSIASISPETRSSSWPTVSMSAMEVGEVRERGRKTAHGG